MKRWTSLLLLLLTLLLLCGCMQLDIRSGVDNEHSAHLSYSLSMDISSLPATTRGDVKRSFMLLSNSYEKKGFTVDQTITDESIQLSMSIKKQGENAEHALELLRAMLMDASITPFVLVDIDGSFAPNESVYILSATLDAKAILDTAHLEYMTQDIRDLIANGLNESDCSITISLPASVVLKSSQDTTINDGIATMQTPLSFEGPTELILNTRATLDNSKVIGAEIGTHIERLNTFSSVLGILRFVAPVLAALCLLWILHARKNAPAIPDEPAVADGTSPTVDAASNASKTKPTRKAGKIDAYKSGAKLHEHLNAHLAQPQHRPFVGRSKLSIKQGKNNRPSRH